MYNKHLAIIQQSVSKGNEKRDNLEGAESSHHYEENYCSPDSKLLLSSPKKSCPKKSIGNLDQHPHPRHIVRHLSPIPRRTQIFHIEKNREVKLGLKAS